MLAACLFGLPLHPFVSRPSPLHVNGYDKVTERADREDGEEDPEGGCHVGYVNHCYFWIVIASRVAITLTISPGNALRVSLILSVLVSIMGLPGFPATFRCPSACLA